MFTVTYALYTYMYALFIAQAVVTEADLRVVEMKKSAYEFDRDIVRGAVNPVRQNIPVQLYSYTAHEHTEWIY